MKKVFSIAMIAFLLMGICTTKLFASIPPKPPKSMEAAWITTVFNTDFPTTKNNVTAQKNEYTKKLDELKAIGINSVVVQVRPKADALYKSNINPWSDVLTGVQGKNPGYDPMAFMIEEAHKRGMAFHAWLNPYRITTSGTNICALCATHPARLHPEWVIKYNNALYYNPKLEAVKSHIISTVKEIVTNYNVDAIHFDDYFYPSNYPLPKGEGIDGIVADSRRQDVNDMIKRVSEVIRSANKNILFGVSPAGIWKNEAHDSTGSDTRGNESYYSVCGDTRTWIKNQWIDYVVPQIYWETGNKAADYETLVKWWSNEVKGTNVKLYIGQGIYNNAVAKQIDTQLNINQKYPEVGGSFYYGLKSLLVDKDGCKKKILAFNQGVPPIISVNRNNGYKTPTTTKKPVAVKTGVVINKFLNIRNGAGLKYDIVAKVYKGAKLTILSIKNGWYNVMILNGKIGWASAEYIKISEK